MGCKETKKKFLFRFFTIFLSLKNGLRKTKNEFSSFLPISGQIWGIFDEVPQDLSILHF